MDRRRFSRRNSHRVGEAFCQLDLVAVSDRLGIGTYHWRHDDRAIRLGRNHRVVLGENRQEQL